MLKAVHMRLWNSFYSFLLIELQVYWNKAIDPGLSHGWEKKPYP